jgi:hypothetical protein
MITGFNTDVQHGSQVYHVQTEDRGTKDNPVLESLVYINGAIIAKKLTPYADKVKAGANDAAIASLLKRQHQIIIAAIKAGRVEDLIKHSHALVHEGAEHPAPVNPTPFVPRTEIPRKPELERPKTGKSGYLNRTSGPLSRKASGSLNKNTGALKLNPSLPTAQKIEAPQPKPAAPLTVQRKRSGPLKTGSLNLDDLISDYLKRSSEQDRLELAVLSPNVFVAGHAITLRVEVKQNGRFEADAIVTVKVIGTAFKPQVYIGRTNEDGIAIFNIALPAFTSGTAAIVVEAQSPLGRGELKHLIRKS